jgi:hypothetical protein
MTDDDIATAFDASTQANQWNCIQQDWAFTSIDLLKLDGTSATSTKAVSAQGSLTSGDWANAVAGVISLKTPQRGARGRGRLFLGPVAESQISLGLLNSVTSISVAWEAFRVAMNAAGASLVVASYQHADQHAVTSLIMHTLPGTMRRRNDQLR